jgi:glycosyltransferase involved in cell wall biosynthesis
LKLAIFVDQVFWFDGERYSTDEPFTKFVIAFEPYFEKIVFCGRVPEERKTEKYILNPDKTEVCALPFYQDVYALWKSGLFVIPKTFSILAREIESWDLVWLCVPHPLSLVFAHLCKRKSIPFFMMVRQNLVEQVRHRNRGVKKIAVIAVTVLLEKWFQALARDHVTFTVGREMYQKYKKEGKPVFEMVVSLITRKDIELSQTISRKRTNEAQKTSLLSIGRLDPEKGLEYLIAAMQILVMEHGREFELHLVGSGRMEELLRRQVNQLGLDQYVQFHGYLPHGPALLELYRMASGFVLPSLTGEGLPQVLLEAMACRVPVIATNVAGIPYLIIDGLNGLLSKF